MLPLIDFIISCIPLGSVSKRLSPDAALPPEPSLSAKIYFASWSSLPQVFHYCNENLLKWSFKITLHLASWSNASSYTFGFLLASGKNQRIPIIWWTLGLLALVYPSSEVILETNCLPIFITKPPRRKILFNIYTKGHMLSPPPARTQNWKVFSPMALLVWVLGGVLISSCGRAKPP